MTSLKQRFKTYMVSESRWIRLFFTYFRKRKNLSEIECLMGIRIFGTSEHFLFQSLHASKCILYNSNNLLLIFFDKLIVFYPVAYSAISVMVNRSWLFDEFVLYLLRSCFICWFFCNLSLSYDKKVKKPGIRFLYRSFFRMFPHANVTDEIYFCKPERHDILNVPMRYANECMSEFFCLPNSNPLRFDVLFFKWSGVKKSKSICDHKIIQSLNIYFEAAFF